MTEFGEREERRADGHRAIPGARGSGCERPIVTRCPVAWAMAPGAGRRRRWTRIGVETRTCTEGGRGERALSGFGRPETRSRPPLGKREVRVGRGGAAEHGARSPGGGRRPPLRIRGEARRGLAADPIDATRLNYRSTRPGRPRRPPAPPCAGTAPGARRGRWRRCPSAPSGRDRHRGRRTGCRGR